MFDTYIGTATGVYRLTDGGVEPLGLGSERIWAIHAWRDDGGSTILAGSYGNGMCRSSDGGETRTCAPVIEDEDVHAITGHPQDPNVLYAALGYASLPSRQRDDEPRRFGGVACSRDAGKTWRKLEIDYTRVVTVPPSRPDLVLAGPAPNVGRGERIVVSTDGGDTWTPADAGIETPMPDMVEQFVAAPDDTVWAVCSGGRLLRSAPGEWFWRSAFPADADLRVQSITFASRAP